MSTRKKFALVTGCGQGGIGEALVKIYAEQGLHPIATLLPSEPSGHLAEVGITFFTLDVTKDDSIQDLKHHIVRLTGGRLDILVNNAGICYTMTAIDTDVGAVSKMFDVNVLGPMRMVHHFHDLLINASGTVVNIGSVGGIVPYVYGSSYNATKAALHHWSNTLRVEMAPLRHVKSIWYPPIFLPANSQFSVKVMTVISGNIGTNILKSDQRENREIPPMFSLTWVVPDSYFHPLKEEFERHISRVPVTTDRFDYASRVVSQSLQSSPAAWFWYGKTTWLVRFLDAFFWRAIWDSLLWRIFDFGKLKRAHDLAQAMPRSS